MALSAPHNKTLTNTKLNQYCANDSNCNFRPSSSNACYPTSGVMAWEGGGQSCGFSTGVYFSWNIQSDAQTKANYSKVGLVTAMSLAVDLNV